MSRLALFIALLLPVSAAAVETTTLPKGAFLLDVSYAYSTLDSYWDDHRVQKPLIDAIDRYEPGGGLQGQITANPLASFHIVPLQLFYGVTDSLTVAVSLPIVLKTTVKTNLGWTPGDYQPSLGRPYSEEDFWEWAGSMGQPRPSGEWVGNQNTLADMVLGTRYRLPELSFTKAANLTWTVGGQVALPTGHPPDPEELIAAGTSVWELHTYGDAELRTAVSRPMFTDGNGVERFVVGADFFYAWLRTRTFQTPKGTKNPLMMNYAPYVGDTYQIDPGDWAGAQLTLDVVPFVGPTFATYITKGDAALADRLPPLLTLTAQYQYTHTNQSTWISQSEMWNYEREKYWGPGDKNALKGAVVLSLLRVGAPLQLYAGYRTQTLIPGRNTRPSNVLSGGVRLIAKFW